MLIRQLSTAFIFLFFLSVITGILYPLSITLIANLIFPFQAQGSFINADNRIVGSLLIGQPFENPGYFWSRPSATIPSPYNANSSNGSNQGPMNKLLLQTIHDRIIFLRRSDPENTNPIPIDLVTASASGLDPEISPNAAFYQISRIAKIRGLKESDLRILIQKHIKQRQGGILGEPRVNVLALNLALNNFAK